LLTQGFALGWYQGAAGGFWGGIFDPTHDADGAVVMKGAPVERNGPTKVGPHFYNGFTAHLKMGPSRLESLTQGFALGWYVARRWRFSRASRAEPTLARHAGEDGAADDG